MKIIKDPVHGYIEVPSSLLPLLDSPAVQRLRYIRQLGFSYLVYPGAHHTRFEHSLGTMHLAGVLARQLELDPGDTCLLEAAALLHDIGHGPFSHSIEPLGEELLGWSHQRPGELCSPELVKVLEGAGVDPVSVFSLIQGSHPLSGIIHGELDVDRMDYLLRDAHYTGVPYGTVDAHRLIRNILRVDDRIVLAESGINTAESLLIARTLMRPAVYYHHVSRIGEMMFQGAVMAHVAPDPAAGLAALLRQDDAACLQALLTSPSRVARDLARGIYERKLYKRALYVGREQVNAARIARCCRYSRRKELAARIAAGAGLEPYQVLVDIPAFPGEMSLHVQVQNRHRVVGLAEVSPLLHTLNETRREQWRLGVYTVSGNREAVEAEAADVLNVRPLTTQERLALS